MLSEALWIDTTFDPCQISLDYICKGPLSLKINYICLSIWRQADMAYSIFWGTCSEYDIGALIFSSIVMPLKG
jgi:hypothetical protein